NLNTAIVLRKPTCCTRSQASSGVRRDSYFSLHECISLGLKSAPPPNANSQSAPIFLNKNNAGSFASAVRRAQLMTELEGITTSEEAIAWARHRLPAKNMLTAGDAQIIEDAFHGKMTALEVDQE